MENFWAESYKMRTIETRCSSESSSGGKKDDKSGEKLRTLPDGCSFAEFSVVFDDSRTREKYEPKSFCGPVAVHRANRWSRLQDLEDVSSAPSAKCEIKSSCSLSSGCQFTNQMTVDPGSKIPTNCSVNTGGKAKVVTWNQAKQRVGTSSGGVSDLVLEKVSSPASGSYSCECTSVNFTRDLQVILGSSTPNIITKDKTFDLECHFVGWPLPTTVNWYKEKSLANNVTHTLITNGTMRMYHSQEKAWKNGKEILRSSLHLPSGTEDQEGFYTCKAQSTIIGWSSSASYTIQMIYECPLPQTPTVSSSQISASKFSNVSLTCLVDTDESGCPEELYWFKNNDKTSLASGGRNPASPGSSLCPSPLIS
ncbi:hypothetical protein AWC38_SpisGene8551 [Stylophora pistillata]|uniref:Ig-like domain-containing protein n=1 Tax=Stylophora pistillata TaxID=50429 RepID=A0A2B4SE19_STYPI|nr:hypothetical protein AWC38_SpisGene8551 [Stylophora pistillata]